MIPLICLWTQTTRVTYIHESAKWFLSSFLSTCISIYCVKPRSHPVSRIFIFENTNILHTRTPGMMRLIAGMLFIGQIR